MTIIACCSFGKDSLAAIITYIQHGGHVDYILYCRVMFTREISGEYPEHETWIHSHAIPLLQEKYGIPTVIVQSEKSYCDYFYTPRIRGKYVGRIMGFPMTIGNWCNDRLKLRPIHAYQKARRITSNNAEETIEIVGIAADETRRIIKKTVKNKILPLVEYGITEEQAMQICREHNLLSPAYNGGRKRLGCWFCSKQRRSELKRLRKEYLELWQQLLVLDYYSPVTFQPNKTLHDIDQKFYLEDLNTKTKLDRWISTTKTLNVDIPCCHSGGHIVNNHYNSVTHISHDVFRGEIRYLMGGSKQFILTQRVITHRYRSGAEIYCKKCGLQLHVGDQVTTNKNSYCSKHSNIYHTACWEGTRV